MDAVNILRVTYCHATVWNVLFPLRHWQVVSRACHRAEAEEEGGVGLYESAIALICFWYIATYLLRQASAAVVEVEEELAF